MLILLAKKDLKDEENKLFYGNLCAFWWLEAETARNSMEEKKIKFVAVKTFTKLHSLRIYITIFIFLFSLFISHLYLFYKLFYLLSPYYDSLLLCDFFFTILLFNPYWISIIFSFMFSYVKIVTLSQIFILCQSRPWEYFYILTNL